MKATTLVLAGVFAMGIMACSDEEPGATGTVTMKAATSTATSGSANGRLLSAVELSDFKINMKEIEFELDDDKIEEITYKDVKLKGPFEIDLLSNTGSLSEVLGIAEVPNGQYEEIEFKIGKGSVAGSSMYGKSIYAAGTIDGVPFVFWHDVDEDFEVDYADSNNDMMIDGRDLSVQINFNLGLVFNSSMGIDLSSARDTDGDGVIEIDPKGEDDNKTLAHDIKELIKDLADLTEDKE
jgi:hypothetical protein